MLGRFLATSEDPLSRLAREVRRRVRAVELPAPRPLVVPALYGVVALRELYYFAARVLVCEPLFKAYCKEYGKNVHTGPSLHWVQGDGDIVLGDNVTLDGKCGITFSSRSSQRPALRVGSNCGIGYQTTFYIGKSITIGSHCRIASEVLIFDTPGHPSDVMRRRREVPPDDDSIRPVTIGDDVWIGRRAIVYPGVKIGQGSIVSAGAVVVSDIPPCTIAAGNPARMIGTVQIDAGGKPPGAGADKAARAGSLRSSESATAAGPKRVES